MDMDHGLGDRVESLLGQHVPVVVEIRRAREGVLDGEGREVDRTGAQGFVDGGEIGKSHGDGRGAVDLADRHLGIGARLAFVGDPKGARLGSCRGR